ncbi:MAG: glycosyltransferase [Chitinophagaceae bacterium]|nr:glycosyltransferase [Chitinophagaceae bacterium]MCW5905656.1 glycosyltransferase [Chitinophagaceae bacterium]
MDNLLVSISCTTYNHAPYFRECLDGFLMQKCNFDFEVLIHDDASTDGTSDIIREYQAKYPKIIKPIIQEENQWSQGIKPTWEFNFPRTKGKYIALCEGDDYWTDPLKLQKQVDFLEQNEDFVGCFHNTYYADERKGKTSELIPWRKYDRDIFTTEDTIHTASLFHTTSYLFRNLKIKIPLVEGVYSGDMLLLGVISKYGKLKLLPDFMSVYRKNDGGITSEENIIKYHRNRIILTQFLNQYFDYKYERKAKQILNHHKNEIFKIKYPFLFKIKELIIFRFYNLSK